MVHLVLHQRDERRNDERSPWHQDGWQLVAQTLASPGGHDDEGILARQDGLDDVLLLAAEGVVAKILLQRLEQVAVGGSGGQQFHGLGLHNIANAAQRRQKT